jgi:hypothetical protein
MQVIQTLGILYVSAVKFAQGATNRNWFIGHTGVTLTIFIVIPSFNCAALCFFVSYHDFNVFSYWFICYVLVGIGMIVWFKITILNMYYGALEIVDKEITNALEEVSQDITDE